jgi:glycosyltransferase involved in cell wall biosynthesis
MSVVAPEHGRLRVLQIMECTIGGTRRHIIDVARGLNAAGVELHLVVAVERQANFREDLDQLRREGCVVHELPMVRSISPLTDLRHLLRLRKLLHQIQPDVVHTHSSKAGVLGRLASQLTGIGKRVHTPHTLAFLFGEMFGPIKRAIFYQIEKHLAGVAHAVVAVSESEANTFRESGIVSPEKIHVIPNGIAPEPFHGASAVPLSEFDLDPDLTTAAIVGLLNVAKGQDLAIRALASREELSALQLLIVGHGEMEAELKQLAHKLGVAERVAFTGFRRDVPGLLAAADFLLLPSRWEGMPYIVLEAMAASRAVVATPVDGAVDLLEEGSTGWFAENISQQAIADVLVRVMELLPETRAQAGRAARERILTGFTDQTMVASLMDLYASLLQGERN